MSLANTTVGMLLALGEMPSEWDPPCIQVLTIARRSGPGVAELVISDGLNTAEAILMPQCEALLTSLAPHSIIRVLNA